MRIGPAPTIRQLLRRLRNAAAQEAGSALIELAVVLALVGIPLLVGTIYTAELLFYDIEVSNAAHAGALYAMRSSTFASDTAGITSAAQAEASDLGTALSVTPVIFYACSSAIDGTHYTTQNAATTACTGGSNHPLQFVQVSTSYAATPFARIAGMQSTVQLTSTSVMEVEE